MKVHLEVPDGSEPVRLDSWLATSLDLPRSHVERLIKAGLVQSAGSPVSKSMTISPGDTFEVDLGAEQEPATAASGFKILLEDEHLAIVSKPAGVVVHPSQGRRSGTLVQALAELMPLAPEAGEGRPGVVHRLDKDTSGLLVFAKTDQAYRVVKAQMQARSITRIYSALAVGAFRMKLGRIEAPLGRMPADPTRMAVTSGGRSAVTEFEVTESLRECSLLSVRLLTGRTHQIRVHLAHIQHPVVGDRAYGSRTIELAGKLGLQRMFLHAARLVLVHPITDQTIDIEDPLPADLQEALEAARSLGQAQPPNEGTSDD